MIGLFALALLTAPTTDLSRAWTAGEALRYRVESSLLVQTLQPGTRNRLPRELDVRYEFRLDVESVGAEGVARVRYRRPAITLVEGQTVDGPPTQRQMARADDLRLWLAPTNEPLRARHVAPTLKMLAPLDGLVKEARRIALFTGELPTSIDLTPKLPLEPVAVGDTWARTVGMLPKAMARHPGRWAPQRVDLVYRYEGVQNGYHRVSARLRYEEDVALALSVLRAPMSLSVDATFDLEPATRRTLRAEAVTTGSIVVDDGSQRGPAFEETWRAKTALTLLR